MEIGDKVTIKKGARYGQDFSFPIWDGKKTVFTIKEKLHSDSLRLQLEAPGYGEKGNYGNGHVYVNENDVEKAPDVKKIKKPIMKELLMSSKIHMGYVLEARQHEEASEKSYDDMKRVGYVRIGEKFKDIHGDDLNDCPYDCNGNIYEGEEIELEKGDVIIIIKK